MKVDESQEILKRFARGKSKFFHLSENEEAVIKFLSAEEAPNHFDGGKTTLIRYHLEVDGKELLWDRVSRDLAIQMSEIPKGTLISIRRTGQKSKTKYFIRKVENEISWAPVSFSSFCPAYSDNDDLYKHAGAWLCFRILLKRSAW